MGSVRGWWREGWEWSGECADKKACVDDMVRASQATNGAALLLGQASEARQLRTAPVLPTSLGLMHLCLHCRPAALALRRSVCSSRAALWSLRRGASGRRRRRPPSGALACGWLSLPCGWLLDLARLLPQGCIVNGKRGLQLPDTARAILVRCVLMHNHCFPHCHTLTGPQMQREQQAASAPPI